MVEEHDSEIPEWEMKDEAVPPALNKKWQDDEKRGIRAGICPECQYPFLEEELSCRHCGKPLEISSGIISDLSHALLRTPWGIVTVAIIILSFIAIIL